MVERTMITFVITGLLLFGTYGCGTTRPGNVFTKEEQQEAPSIEGVHYATVIFDKGKAGLKNFNQKNLKKLIKKAQKQKLPIEEIRILAWSDNEYPDKIEGETSKEDIAIASERGKRIKDFLEKELKEGDDIDAYNMAKRPDLLSKILRNDEFRIKEAFESSGATASELPDGTLSYTKASKAIVIIDYEGQ